MAFKPFNDALQQISNAFSAVNTKLANKFDKIERVLPTVGTIHELRNRNSYGLVSGVGFKGRVEMAYDRVNLSKFMGTVAKQDQTIRTRAHPLTTAAALTLANRKWNFGIPASSVQDLPVVYDGNGIGTVTVRAVEGDVTVFGEFQFKLQPGPDNIAALGLNGDLGAALYPSGQYAKGQAQLLSYPLDTTTYNAYLAGVWAGQPIDTALLDCVSALTGVSWIMTAGQYSLSGATVTYAGPVRSGYDLPKENYSRIVTIRLGSACSNFAGDLVLYHNPN